MLKYLAVLSAAVPIFLAGMTASAAEIGPAERAEIRAVLAKSLPLLQKGAAGHTRQRTCFACHNQALPILALTTARERGFEPDDEELRKQLEFIADFLGKNQESYKKGRGQGGQVDTAGYALWTLAQGGWKPDDTTAAVAEYLLLYQKELDHWRVIANRPPSEASSFTANYLALRGLQVYGTAEQKERIAARTDQVRGWLEKTRPRDTEDRVFRLWALKAAGADEKVIAAAVKDLVETQREDGGWSQLASMDSDAYATGSALVVLHNAGGLTVDAPVYRRGVKFLLQTQLDDGSWKVKSRSKPFQLYYESGFPHGKDQFISSAASGWAATALALACPLEEPKQLPERAPAPVLVK